MIAFGVSPVPWNLRNHDHKVRFNICIGIEREKVAQLIRWLNSTVSSVQFE